MNVSQQLLNILRDQGVTHVFGVAGDALNPLVAAIAGQDEVKWVRVKHEGNGSYAAFAQGELGEGLGVCASTVGPGALHLVNGLYNAKKERSPVLVITGQIPVEHIGTNFFQEVDLTRVFDDICDYQAVVRSPAEAPRVMLRAIRTALENRSVCRIELPADIASMDAENEDFVHRVFRSQSRVVPALEVIDEAVAMIDEATRVGILAGAGCRDARDDVLEFAGKVKAPITHTVRSSDVFDHSAPHVVGLTGLIGNESGYKAVMECDLLLMIGTDFPYTDFLPDDTRTIQVDVRPVNIGNRTPVDLGIHGDVGTVVPELHRKCQTKEDSRFHDDLRASFEDWKRTMREESSPEKDIEPLHPQIFARGVSDIASDDAIFTIDTGTAAIWATNHMDFHSDRRVIGSFNHGSMAVGLPAAIGAQLRHPDREVWALVGDGAFQMSMQDFVTAAEYELPIKVLVFHNSELGFVKIEMEEAGLAPDFDALGIPEFDFCAFAEVCGGESARVEAATDIMPAIEEAKRSTKPFVIDAVVTGGEISLPPGLGVGQVGKFGVSKLKQVVDALRGDHEQWQNIKREVDAFFDKKT